MVTSPAVLTASEPPAAAAAPAGEPRGRARGLLIWAAVVLTIGLLQFTYHHLGVLAAGQAGAFLKPLINEMTAAFGAGLLFFAVRALVRHRPLGRGRWLRRLPLYAAALVAFSASHTSLNWGLRSLLYPLAGFGAYDYGIMPLRYFMELPVDVMAFVLMVGLVHGADHLRAARERELRTAQLESSLAQAQLRSLRLQLQPHFLFNALNTISATMYHDPAAADEMLDRLAELLRASLRTAQTDEVPLATELEVLDCYLAILQARFGPRLAVTLEVEPEVRGALVPSMLLQPLVENAVRHGNAERAGRGAVILRARRRGTELELEVEDDGPGIRSTSPAAGSGVGLTATAERLQLLYGSGHELTAGNLPAGGFRVRVRLPLRQPGGTAP